MYMKRMRPLHKSDGSIIDSFSSIFVVVVIALMLVFYIGMMQNVGKKDTVNRIARKYMLQMETQGYLDGSSQGSLKAELAQAGMKTVNLSGTTSSRANYGQPIYLKITGPLEVSELGLRGHSLQIANTPGTIPIQVEMESTAKY